MYLPVHHGNEPVLLKGKVTRVFNAPGKKVRIKGKGFSIQAIRHKKDFAKAAKVGIPLIGKLIKGFSKQGKKKRRNKSKWKHLKGGNPLWMFGNFGKFTAGWLGALDTIYKKADKAAKAYEKRHNL